MTCSLNSNTTYLDVSGVPTNLSNSFETIETATTTCDSLVTSYEPAQLEFIFLSFAIMLGVMLFVGIVGWLINYWKYKN